MRSSLLNALYIGASNAGFLLLVLFFGLFSSCGAKRAVYEYGSLQVETASSKFAQQLRRLDTLACPNGVDPLLFEEIKLSLREALVVKSDKEALKYPTGEANKVTDLDAEFIDGSWVLTWSGKNVGDYNADGQVNVMDIFPLADHFYEKVETSENVELARWVDGDGSGRIDIGDVFPIADNFFSKLSGYVILHAEKPIEEVPTEEDYSVFAGTDTTFVSRLEPAYPGQPPHFEYTIPPGLNPDLIHYFKVAPVAIGESGYGPLSNEAFIPPQSATNLFVHILFPREGQTVSGTIPVFVAYPIARDDLESVAYDVDGTPIGSSSEFPFAIEWDTTTVSDGSHTLRAVISTTQAETAEDSISVTVDQSFVPQIPDPTQPGPYLSASATFLMLPNGETGSTMLGSLIYYPSDDGSTISADAPFPFVVIARAEDVPVSEYSYLAEYLATHGYVVVVPNYPQSTLFQLEKTDISTRAKDLKWTVEYLVGSSFIAESPYYGWVIPDFSCIGHGIGFAAIVYMLLAEDFGTFGLVGISPQENFVEGGDVIPLLANLPRQAPYIPMIVVGAENDGLSEVGKDFVAYYDAHPGPAFRGRIKGGNFSGFTDSQNIAGDGSLTITRDDQHFLTSAYATIFLGMTQKGYESYFAYMDGTIPGWGINDPRLDMLAGKGEPGQ